MIKCFIVDDEQPSIDVLTSYIKRVPKLELIGTATNPVEGITMISRLQPELIFLDIQMDEMSGIELSRLLPKNARVIFCTAYSEFAAASYDLEATDYLLKPIHFDRFMQAVRKATELLRSPEKKNQDDHFFVKTELKGKLLKIKMADIDFVEACNNYVAFHMSGKRIMALLNLRDVAAKLPATIFFRIHRSFIIALDRIQLIEGKTVKLRGYTQQISIGNQYRKAFMEIISGRTF